MEVLVKGQKVIIPKHEIGTYKQQAFELAYPYFDLISSPNIKRFSKAMWEKAPSYFFVIPASSSGKYHAEWATELGGLVKHVLMGVQVAYDLSVTFGLTDHQTDLALSAMFGHDLFKYGIEYDTRYSDMHPFIPRSYFSNPKSEGYISHILENPQDFKTIMDAIERHMGSLADGSWTCVSKGSGRFKPETPIEQVVHLADYIASRKNLSLVDWEVGK